jgi:hypothetical protein
MTMTGETKAVFARPEVRQWMKERCAEREHLRFIVGNSGQVFALTMDNQFAVQGVLGWRSDSIGQTDSHWQWAWNDGRAFDETWPPADSVADPDDKKPRWVVSWDKYSSIWRITCWRAGCESGGTSYAKKQKALEIAAECNNDWRVPVLDDYGVEHIENIMRPEAREFFEREDVRKEIERLRKEGADTFIAGVPQGVPPDTKHLIAWRGDEFCVFDIRVGQCLAPWRSRYYSTEQLEVQFAVVLKDGRLLIEETPITETDATSDTEQSLAAVVSHELSICATCKAPVTELDVAGDCAYCSHRANVDASIAFERQSPEPKNDYGDVGPWDARDLDYEL